jgi:putative membrane-bound dehydrogenase-like protein
MPAGNGFSSRKQLQSARGSIFREDPIMKHALVWPVALILVGTSVGKSTAFDVELNGHTFTLPEGFVIELVAGPPLVDRPIVADFDEEGTLYIAESSGTNDPVEEQLAEKPHRILRLEDSDGDGRFDRRTVFADAMMFPEGAMWLDGALFVAAPPSIWKLQDTDGDGVANERSEWFEGKTLTGCANDLHGPYRGPDGWIYWCKGAFARQVHERPGHEPFVTRAAHIFRCRPDGSGLEAVMTGGMDNPVDVVFTPGGERIFTTTFFQHPGGGQRDGLIHAVYGGVYGKVHDVIGEHPWTSPHVMPVLAHMGPAAPCGLARYESEVFGAEYQDNLFAAQFNMQKVSRHVLAPSGATFTTRDEDFVVSSNKDFHPTDVLADADGSLIIVDTGGWYKLCCPTSQLWKPDVLGGIYRVRRKSAPSIEDPRGRKLDWASLETEELVRLLGDARPAVRERAVAQMAKLGRDAPFGELADKIQAADSTIARAGAVWAATRIDNKAARAAIRLALDGPDETVRQAAIHSISVWRDAAAVPLLVKILEGSSLHNRRAAAEALGRIGDPAATGPLLSALERASDRVLEHSLIFALIEIGDASGTARGLQSANTNVQRAAMIALDQMNGDPLGVEPVAKAMASPHAALREAAGWIAGRHPQWGDDLAAVFRERLADFELSDSERSELEGQLARLATNSAIQGLLADLAGDASTPMPKRLSALRAMASSGLKGVPDAWVRALASVPADGDAMLVSKAVSAARSFGIGENDNNVQPLVEALVRIAADENVSTEVRLEAVAAAGERAGAPSDDLFAFLHGQLSLDAPARARSLAVEALTKAPLSDEQLIALTTSLKTAGPLELDRLLAAFEKSSEERIGLELVTALNEAAALSSLRAETLRPRLEKFGQEVHNEAQAIYARLETGAGDQRSRLEEILESLPQGDIRRGQAVFNGTKAACASCHAIGYLGGKLGPDLTSIGRVREKRDLVESIVFPSASFVRSYESLTVATVEGKLHNGLVQRESPDEIVLALAADQNVRIPRDQIEDIFPGTVSIMPAGLDQQLTLEELADLVEFLAACR